MSNNIIAYGDSKDRIIALVIKALPWIAAPIIFFMVCNHFFAPQFDNKSLSQGDIAQYEGMAHDIKEHREATGEDPQWTGNMFSGMPAYLIDMEYPTQDVKQSVGQTIKIMDEPMSIIFFAMLLMMVAVVLMGINPWIGIIAGLAYGLSTYFFLIIDAGHITKAWAMVYAPPLVGAVWYTLRRNMWAGGVLAALFGSLELGANHPQITYYFLLVCFALWCSEMWFAHRDKMWRNFGKRTAILAIAALLAGASNFAPLWYAASHQKHTVRGINDESKSEEEARKGQIDWNTEWSYGKAESFNMLVPNYMCALPSDGLLINEAAAILGSEDAQKFFSERAYDYADTKMQELTPEQLHNEVINSIWTQNSSYYGTSLTVEDVERMLLSDEENYNTIYIPELNHIRDNYFERFFYEGNEELNSPIYKASSYIYWGDQPFTAGPTYIGIVVVFLAILGIFVTTGRNRWWLMAITIFAIFLAWGKNMLWFYELMFDILPGYSSYRTVSMALVIVEWSAVLLAAYALMALWNNKLSMRRLVWSILATTGVIFAMIIIMGAITDYGVDKLGDALNTPWGNDIRDIVYEARREAFMSDAWRGVIYTSLTAAVLLTYVWIRNRDLKQALVIKALPYIMLLMVGGLMVNDLMDVNDRYFNNNNWHDKVEKRVEPTAADKQIMEDEELGFRVFDLNHAGTTHASNFHRSVDGYHGAKLGRYDAVLDGYIANNTLGINYNVLSMLNVKYLISNDQVYDNPTYGAAWLAKSPKLVDSAMEAFEAIGQTALEECAIVEPSAPKLKAKYDTSGSIRLVEYAPNYLKYEYDSPGEALAVFSEIYYPDGWSVYVDGKEAEYFCVDYILRGMELPAGRHTIEWRFRAPHWGMATAITGIGSWLILIALLVLMTAPLWRRYLLPYIKQRYEQMKTKR